MLKLLVPVLAAAALAAPAAAFACDGGGHHSGASAGLLSFRFGVGDHGGGQFAKLAGTGTSFGSDSATASGDVVRGDLASGPWSATLATTWSSAESKSFQDTDGDNDDGTVTVSCAPATASVTLGGSTESLTGKTCSLTRNGTTVYGFAGKASNGDRAFLKEDGSTVKGVALSGEGAHFGLFLHSGDHH